VRRKRDWEGDSPEGELSHSMLRWPYMLTEYIDAAMRHARYEMFEDKTYYGEIPECNGVWANEATLEACRNDLRSALEDWLIFSLSKQLPIPVIDGIELAIHEEELA
jgi:predicted RNase H-like HicB family nuclease